MVRRGRKRSQSTKATLNMNFLLHTATKHTLNHGKASISCSLSEQSNTQTSFNMMKLVSSTFTETDKVNVDYLAFLALSRVSVLTYMK